MYCSMLNRRNGGITVFCRITACQNIRSVFSMGTWTESFKLPSVMASIRCWAFFRAMSRGRDRVTLMLRTGFNR